MKNQIAKWLNLSLVPDSQTLKEATQQLAELAKQPGFCMAAMQIADDHSNNVPVRQAALVQFKNNVKKYWKATDYEIKPEEKSAILGALLPAFVRSSQNYPLLKMYKDVVTTIVGFTYQTWLPTDILCGYLSTDHAPIATLHLIIAIETNFEISINDDERIAFYTYLMSILPTLYNFVQRNSNEEVIYLTMKILWKIVHYEVSNEVRNALCGWMDLILSVAGASNQMLEARVEEEQARGTVEFFYFHAKKWATRILYRFIYRHACANSGLLATEQAKQANRDFSKLWYERFGERVIDVITKQFMVPTITKTRYFQIKSLTGLINNQPQLMKNFSQSFQYHILPVYLQLKPEDEEIANSDPIEFMNREDHYTFNYTYLKKAAMEAWVAFTNIGAKKKKKGKAEQIGVLFNDNIKFLQAKLEAANPLEKEMAMYLICHLRVTIESSESVKAVLPSLISKYVVPEFTSDIMFLRARSMQIFDEYGDLGFDNSIIKKIVEGIYFCLTQDNFPLVRLRAASAFHVLLQHEIAREEVKPLFKQILEIYLILLEKYDSENLVLSLTGIVEHFSVQIGPYAGELMKYLSKHFIKLFNKDKQKASDVDYDGQTEMAASGVLNTMKILLQAPIDKQNVAKMQPDIMDVCDYVFCSNDIDYIDDILNVLRAYTHRAPALTERLLFYYAVIIYYVVGIDQAFWPRIEELPIPEINKRGLNTVRGACNVQCIAEVTLVLRNYIALDSQTLLKTTDPFGTNMIELLFQMINQIYQKGPDEFEGEVEMNSCTVLIMYLLENNYGKWNETFLTHMWQVAKYNLMKAKSKSLNTLNAQLLCVLLWNNCEKTVQLAQSENLLGGMFACIVKSEPKIRQEHERQRIILGINEVLVYNKMTQEMLVALPTLFQYAARLVKKNCELRLDLQDDGNYLTDSEAQDSEDELNAVLDLDQNEPEDIWQEDFENNYSSKLDEIDEIKYFRHSIQKMQAEQPAIYAQLIATIPGDELAALDHNMAKAIAFNEPEC